ncbi:MAG: chitobiase/beta-hexosaminidase C-terminal domain-containing protein, partial [Bacteroidota bacterium]
TGQNIQPQDLAASYDLIKALDPYHPVSIVFMNPKAAIRYQEVMDIVMADPYPIPNRAPTEAGEVIEALAETFKYKIPVWLVPQAFGGSEHWAREPSPGEIRLMTWLGTLHGASGIQYFIRHGLSSFPKSSLTWDAASAAIKEIKNLSPALLQPDASKMLEAPDKDIEAKWYCKDGKLFLVVLNTNKKPKNFLLRLDGLQFPEAGEVLFEDREIQVNNNRLQDIIDGYGRRIYQFQLEEPRSSDLIYTQNRLVDPSFENSLVPGTPAACYFKLRGDRGAHAQLDTRSAVDGRHSLKLVTPSFDNGIDVSLFPIQLETGKSYALSFWAKGTNNNQAIYFRLGNGAEKEFRLSPSWKNYQWVFKAQGNEATRNNKTGILFSLITPGQAWVDVVQLIPEPRIEFEQQPFAESTQVSIASAQQNDPSISINYTLDGSVPNITSPPYNGPIRITSPTTIQASVTKGNQNFVATENILVNMIPVEKVRYQQSYYEKYAANGERSLIDGQLGSLRFTDGQWQGWNKGNVDLFLDLKEAQAIRQLHLNFLSDHANWIYPPERIEIYASKNGKRFKRIAQKQFDKPGFDPVAQTLRTTISLDNNSYQSIQVVVIRPSALPSDHPSSGGNPFVFID